MKWRFYDEIIEGNWKRWFNRKRRCRRNNRDLKVCGET